MFAVCTHHLPSGDKDFLQWGRVLASTGDPLTIKWQIDKELQDCNVADVHQDEKAARAAAKSAGVVDVQPKPMVRIHIKQLIVLESHRGTMQYDPTMCADIFACNLSR